MKRLVVAVMLLAALAAAADAETLQRGVKYTGKDGQPVGGYNTTDSLFYPLRTDAASNLYIRDAYSNRENYRPGTTAIINDTLAIGSADSSAVIDVHDLRTLGLLVAVYGADTTTTLAIQVRYHLSGLSDSTSIFAATTDSLLAYVSGSTTTVSSVSERPVVFNFAGGGFTNLEHRRYLPIECLVGPSGVSPWFHYISVRVRVLTGSESDTSCIVKVYLVGSSL